MGRWVWGVAGGCCGLGLWWAVLEAAGAGHDAWWAVAGRVLAVTGGVAAADRVRGRWG
ncbi:MULTISPECIES: hypothetical protein [Streptomycetaceae]|uniref:hypothetical protein n=1 Tax=Streptomycetaceae TaxID=2062 RepID=UPI000A6A6E4E|nr:MULTISPECIES: hypothetical protein [Streptomycetaceae]